MKTLVQNGAKMCELATCIDNLITLVMNAYGKNN